MDYLRFGKKDGEKFVILPGLALKSVMGLAEGIISAYALIAEKYDVYLSIMYVWSRRDTAFPTWRTIRLPLSMNWGSITCTSWAFPWAEWCRRRSR